MNCDDNASSNCVLAIDIGVKTLSMCILDQTNTIKMWGVYNTLADSSEQRCKSVQKNGKICSKLCSVKKEEEFFCKTHSPTDCAPYAPKKMKDYSLQDLTKYVITCLNEIISNNTEAFSSVKCVLLELQPTFAVKMKFVSHVIYTKLVSHFMESDVIVRFVKATEKLKVYDGPPIVCAKKGYAKRKYESIEHAKYFLNEKFSEEQRELWAPLLDCSKADDLSDAFLYAMYFHHYANNFNKSPDKVVYKGTKFKKFRKSKKKCAV